MPNKRIISGLAAAVFALSGGGAYVGNVLDLRLDVGAYAATVGSGKLGDNLTWTVDEEGTLTISGTGEMAEEIYYPWKEFRDEENIKIKKAIINSGVTNINMGAFGGLIELESVTIPDTVTSIDIGAFDDCKELTEINIPDSVTSIGEYAFCYCTKLKSLHLPDGITNIGTGAFSGCTRLTEINIPKSLTSINPGLFDRCESLTAITIPDNITSIGDGAFQNCTSLADITISKHITDIGNSAFYNTAWLEARRAENPLVIVNNILIDGTTAKGNVTIPDGVTRISGVAFLRNWDLTGITLPNSLKSIGREAFYNCVSLTSITIPDGVTTIDEFAFYYCENLKSVSLPDSIINIGSCAFADCESLTEINIPKSLTDISNSTFAGCTSLTSITIPDSVTSIGDCAFYDCQKLKEITIPDSVTKIGTDAFGYYYDTIDDYKYKIDKFKIYCNKGTAGEKYAKENGFDYAPIGDTGPGEPDIEIKDIKGAKVSYNAMKVSYTGKKVIPKVTVTYDGKTLVRGTDYKLTGKNNIKPGKGIIYVNGIGSFSGKKGVYYYIVPKKPTMTKATSTTKKKIALGWKKDSLADGYQIIVYSDKGCTKKVKSVLVKKNSTVKGTISGFTSGKTYYVRMRAYKTIDGTKQTGAFCAVKTVKVK